MAAQPTPPLFARGSAAVDAVIFDFDGTLVATRSSDEAAVAELVAADPRAAETASIFWAHDGEPLLARIEFAWPGRGAEVLRIFDRQGDPLTYPGIRPLLRSLSRQGLPMAVVSSRRRQALLAGLAATGLSGHFGVVVGLDDVHEPKPSPEGLIRAMRALGARPPRTVYVGDNLLDVEAGRRAGVTVWRAVWGTVPPSPNGVVQLLTPGEVRSRLAALEAPRSRPGARARARARALPPRGTGPTPA
jgi:pyrophosphatase PpaX